MLKQAVESVYIVYGFGHAKPKNPIMFSACIACLHAMLAATYSAEHEESTTIVCFKLPHNSGVPLRKITYPLTLCFVSPIAKDASA
jgi:hypothetical protein